MSNKTLPTPGVSADLKRQHSIQPQACIAAISRRSRLGEECRAERASASAAVKAAALLRFLKIDNRRRMLDRM